MNVKEKVHNRHIGLRVSEALYREFEDTVGQGNISKAIRTFIEDTVSQKETKRIDILKFAAEKLEEHFKQTEDRYNEYVICEHCKCSVVIKADLTFLERKTGAMKYPFSIWIQRRNYYHSEDDFELEQLQYFDFMMLNGEVVFKPETSQKVIDTILNALLNSEAIDFYNKSQVNQ